MCKDISTNGPKKAWEAWKKKQSQQVEHPMPLTKKDLRSLFDFLKRESAPPCVHTLDETMRFLRERKLQADKILPWLRQHGGYCDCEVIYNVEDRFKELVRAA